MSALIKPKPLPLDAMTFYINHPVEFTEQQVYGVQRPDGSLKTLALHEVKENRINRRLEWQTKEILNAIANYDYVSIHSGRGISKTASLAFAAIWFLYTRRESKVIITGPKYEQLKITIWAEISMWLSKSYLKDTLRCTAERMYHVESPPTWFGRIITAADKENLSGVHGPHVLWLVDEASNVEEVFIDNIIGGMTDPECKIVMAGNPTKISGAFYKSFTTESQYWHVLQYSSEDSARKNPVWFKRMQKYPKDSDMYRVNVLGLPPQGNPRGVIQLADLYAARDREMKFGTQQEASYLEMAVDPAAEGNDLTAIAIRRGMVLLEVRTFSKSKAPETIVHIIKMLREYRAKTKLKGKCRIKIDNHGIGQMIKHYLALNETDNIEVVPINFGRIQNEEYADNITKMWFEFANMLENISLPNDDDLIEEFCAREWVPVDQSKVKVEPKYDFKKRLGHSPDKTDAVVMCYTDGAKKVFTRGLDTEPNVKNFIIDYKLDKALDFTFDGLVFAEVVHVCAMVLNDDLTVNGLVAAYQYYRNILWVYGEFHHAYPVADMIVQKAKEMTLAGKFNDDREPRFFGSYSMFKTAQDKRPFSEVLRRNGLNVLEPLHFDEYGSISFGIQLYNENRMVINRNLIRFREQFSLWVLDKTKTQGRNAEYGKPAGGYGYCDALLIILSEVRKRMRPPDKEPRIRDYHRAIRENPEENDKLAWLRR